MIINAVRTAPGRVALTIAMAAALLVGAAGSASAQSFPAKPIRLVIGVPGGTTTDVGVRLFSAHMAKRLGQPVIVEPRPGANLTIAANFVVKSDPDGYTLFYSPAFVFHPVFVKNNPVDARTAFETVSLASTTEYMMVASGKLPAANWKETLAWIRANPGKLNFGSVAPGFDLMMNMIGQTSGFAYTSVPYAGSALVAQPLIAGDVHLSISSPAVFQSHIAQGTIKGFWTTGRSAIFPNLPSAGEMGYPDLDDIRLNFYFWAPARTPTDVVARVSESVQYAAKLPELIEQHRKLFGVDPVGSTPADGRRTMERELGAWAKLAKLGNFQPQ